MIDNMPQQNSPFWSFEAKVLIPVWKTGERETRGGSFFFFFLLVVILHQDGKAQHEATRMREGGKHETDIGKWTLRQQAVGQRVGKKVKSEYMGKTKRPNAEGWKKRWGWSWVESVACGKILKPVHVKTRLPDLWGGSSWAKTQRGGEPESDTQDFQIPYCTNLLQTIYTQV